MQTEKKQLEILLMDYFRMCYPDFPKGRVVPSESPDFWVRKKNKNVIGIELTRLNPVHAEIPDNSRQKVIDSRNEIILNAREIYERTSDLKLFVKFLFSEKDLISVERAMSVSVRMAGLIRNQTQKERKTKLFFKKITKEKLPRGVEEILIVNHPSFNQNIWERSNNLGISNDVIEDIHIAIQKKDEKLRLYHKNHLNFYWLLITTDRLRGTKNYNLANKIANATFNSQFQHVFLFDLIKSKIYELV